MSTAIKMQDLERAATASTSCVFSAGKTRSRQDTLRLPPDDPYILVDDSDRVISEVSAQIEKRRARGDGEEGDKLASKLDKFKKLRYSFKLDLFLSATDYSFAENDGIEGSGRLSGLLAAYSKQGSSHAF